MSFEFAAPARIIFGDNCSARLPQLARDLGRRALLVTGKSQPPAVSALIAALHEADFDFTRFPVIGEPTVEVIDKAKAAAIAAGCDMVISIGGGSVIDSGKASAALIPNEGAVIDYLEVIGAGRKLEAAPLPFIALPTTAGSGAEATKNAVLGSKRHRVKVSLRDNRMLADIALVDPRLTHSLPPAVTASTGLDALTQTLEPFVSHLATSLTDGFCREGLRCAGRSLRRVYEEPDNAEAREDMALTSLLGGLALANAKLGAVHGFAGVLGGIYGAPHGLICAALLPPVIEANIKALSERQADSPALSRYDQAARLLLDAPSAKARDAVNWISETSRALGIPGLASAGLQAADFAEVVAKSSVSSSMKGNPIALTAEELTAILHAAL